MYPSARHPDLDGASVLITGGGSGIGAALTTAFADQGAKVAFIDYDREASEALVAQVTSKGGAVRFLHADLRDLEALKAAATEAADVHGPVSVLVNNAARDDRDAVEAVTEGSWDDNHAINLRPHFFTAQAVVPGMKALGRGSIVNFTSTAYMINGGAYPVYAAAKAGIVGLTKSLAGALGPHGIRVNAIAPGWVLTERQRRLWVTEEALAAHIDRQCLKTELQAEDMVGACLFLASDASRVMTAQTLIVDGGVV